ncbi:MAG: hypothetical protein KAS17_04455 [Victivallaceae bacterium]|nr:hypothetical protein [Victivallaceae bacterium]
MFKKAISILIVMFAAGGILYAESVIKTTPAPKLKIIDFNNSGTYTSGKWKYVYTITNKGSKSQGCLGELFYNGKRVRPLRFLDFRKTPWGEIIQGGVTSVMSGKAEGWMPREEVESSPTLDMNQVPFLKQKAK